MFKLTRMFKLGGICKKSARAMNFNLYPIGSKHSFNTWYISEKSSALNGYKNSMVETDTDSLDYESKFRFQDYNTDVSNEWGVKFENPHQRDVTKEITEPINIEAENDHIIQTTNTSEVVRESTTEEESANWNLGNSQNTNQDAEKKKTKRVARKPKVKSEKSTEDSKDTKNKISNKKGKVAAVEKKATTKKTLTKKKSETGEKKVKSNKTNTKNVEKTTKKTTGKKEASKTVNSKSSAKSTKARATLEKKPKTRTVKPKSDKVAKNTKTSKKSSLNTTKETKTERKPRQKKVKTVSEQ